MYFTQLAPTYNKLIESLEIVRKIQRAPLQAKVSDYASDLITLHDIITKTIDSFAWMRISEE
jgi:hypothetical protein